MACKVCQQALQSVQGKLQEYGGVEHNADGVMGGSSKASLMAVNLPRFKKSQLHVTDHVLSFFFQKADNTLYLKLIFRYFSHSGLVSQNSDSNVNVCDST